MKVDFTWRSYFWLDTRQSWGKSQDK